ncbi:MAG: alpha/beta hydrolase-fold protein [Bacteroidota bacterium]
MKKLFFLIIISTQINLFAQELPLVNIPGSQVQKITSRIVTGQEYELQILLPGGYKNSTKKYPVLYLLDSQWDFPLAKSLYGQHYFDGFIPEMIIVGVTWGGTNPNPDSLRARDYTPTREARLPQSGGADNFLSFMRSELFSFIDAKYKTDTTDRLLMGCSLGGLFTMYTLFTHPGMFNSYIAASPAYGWDREVLYQYEKKYFESNPSRPARLYFTMGEVERGLPGFERLAKHLASRNYKNITMRSKVLENTGHSGTKTEGFGRGMQFAYEKPKLRLSESSLNKLVGKYAINDRNTIELKAENDGLVCYLGPTNKYILYAASETDFYATSEFFNIHFTLNGNKVTELKLDRYGRSDTAKKLY